MNIYGAPILQSGNLIGIVLAEVDVDEVVFHLVEDCVDWINEKIIRTSEMRSNLSKLFNNYPTSIGNFMQYVWIFKIR